jgi:hypothetical protein
MTQKREREGGAIGHEAEGTRHNVKEDEQSRIEDKHKLSSV